MNHDWVNVNICGTKLGFLKKYNFYTKVEICRDLSRYIEKM